VGGLRPESNSTDWYGYKIGGRLALREVSKYDFPFAPNPGMARVNSVSCFGASTESFNDAPGLVSYDMREE